MLGLSMAPLHVDEPAEFKLTRHVSLAPMVGGYDECTVWEWPPYINKQLPCGEKNCLRVAITTFDEEDVSIQGMI